MPTRDAGPEQILNVPRFAPDAEMEVTHMKRAHVSQPEDAYVPRAVRPNEQPFLIDGDMLQVFNDGETTFVFKWARKSYRVAPHGSAFVPFEATVNQLGDPRSAEGELVKFDDGNGNRGIVLTRYDEICRLFAQYAIPEENMEKLVQAAPKLRAETMTGQPVYFPIHHPDMIQFPVNNIDTKQVSTDVRRMHDNLQQENADLKARADRMEEMLDQLIREREGAPATA